jgi:putative acetyltransferase
MRKDGYLDKLYVHKDYQGKFIAFHLLREIEKIARELGLSKITTHCSITAKIPAERMGFLVIKEQAVIRNGISLINFVMEKKL